MLSQSVEFQSRIPYLLSSCFDLVSVGVQPSPCHHHIPHQVRAGLASSRRGKNKSHSDARDLVSVTLDVSLSLPLNLKMEQFIQVYTDERLQQGFGYAVKSFQRLDTISSSAILLKGYREQISNAMNPFIYERSCSLHR